MVDQLITDFGNENFVPQLALDYVRKKAVTAAFSYADVWREEHLRAFTVAKMMQDDLLEFVQDEISKSIKNGTAYSAFRKIVEPRLMQAGWWGKADLEDPKTGEVKRVQLGSPARLKLIYEQNINTAYARQTWQDYDVSDDIIPYLQYVIGPSREHRPQHLAWNGMVLRKDDPFWDVGFPPSGFGCKCSVIGLSQFNVERRGLTVSKAPTLTPTVYRNKRTGKVHQGYEEIDPGFEFNVGKISMREFETRIRQHTLAIASGEELGVCRVCG